MSVTDLDYHWKSELTGKVLGEKYVVASENVYFDLRKIKLIFFYNSRLHSIILLLK